jgi:hypothetical protein
MQIKGTSSNNKVFMQIKDLNNLQSRAIRQGFYDIGKTLVNDAVNFINEKPKSGRTYLVRIGKGGKLLKNRKKHIASAAGESPAVITGKLRDSVNFLVHGDTRMEFGVDDKKGVKYGKFLEYSDLVSMTGKGSKNIEPRPFISKSYKKNEQQMINIFTNSLEKNLKKI